LVQLDRDLDLGDDRRARLLSLCRSHVTATDRSFLNRDLLKDGNFVAGTVLMFFIGIILNGTLALVPTMLQDLMNYPVLTTGLVTAPRGIGTMVAMFLVVHLINRVDTRLIILTGLGLTAVSLWQMTGFLCRWGWDRSSRPVYCRALDSGLSSPR
jgi:DHA2 family multidrug resistance protein